MIGEKFCRRKRTGETFPLLPVLDDGRKEDLEQVDVYFLCDLVEDYEIAMETGIIRRKEKWMSAAEKYMEERPFADKQDLFYVCEVLKKKWDLEK